MERPFIVKPGDNISLDGVGNGCTPEYTGAYRKKVKQKNR